MNFEKLDYISSAGLRVLLAAAKQLKGIDGELRICSLNEVVREVFDISGFTTIFKVFGSESEALDGFEAGNIIFPYHGRHHDGGDR